MKGPVVDRIDITRNLAPVRRDSGRDPLATRESTAVVRSRVEAARRRQHDRYQNESWRLNGHVPGPVLAERWPLADEGRDFLQQQVWDGRLTMRGSARVQRLAWTVADLSGVVRPGLEETDTALRLRTGEPLMGHVLRRRAG